MTITIKPHRAGGVLVTLEQDGRVILQDRACDEAKALHMIWRRMASKAARRRQDGRYAAGEGA